MTDEPAPNSPWGGPSDRGPKGRKRDDYGVELFRAAVESFSDPLRLKHALLELSRCYNPVANAPILEPAVRRRIVELVDAGRRDEARQLLEECMAAYAGHGQGSG